MKKTAIALLLGISLGFSATHTLAAAGRVEFATGDVKIKSRGGVEQTARKGSEINEGDTVISGKPGFAQIRFEDGGIVVVHAATEFNVKKFVYNQPDKTKDVANFALLKGRLRAITGEVGSVHKENYTIETPLSQMGVRGTDHETIFIPQPGPGELAIGAPGTYNKVNAGGTYIQSANGRVDVNPGQAGFADAAKAQPGVLAQLPSIYLSPGADAPKRRFIQVDADGSSAPIVRELPPAAVSASITAFGGVGGTRTLVGSGFITGTATQANIGGDAALGVDWGRWDGAYIVPGVTGTTGSMHYINASNITSAAQLAALPGAGVVTATYQFAGGTLPTNQLGQTGNIVSATAVANFTTSMLTGYTLNANTPGRNWNVSGNGSFAQFGSSNGIALTGFCTGCAVAAATGQASGQFTGAAAQGIVSGFGVQSGTDSASGAILLKR